MVNRVDGSARHVLRDLDGLLRRAGADMPALFAARVHGDDAATGMRGGAARLLDLLDDGLRQTALARVAGVTKQAVGERVRELQARGLVRTAADPDDRRAVLVQRTPHGDAVLRATREAVADLERCWRDQVGAERYAVFREVLAELSGPHRPGSPPGDQPATMAP